jgi:hypothetical protein
MTKLTTSRVPSNARRYNNLSNGHGDRVHLPIEAEIVTILQLFVMVGGGLAHLSVPQTGDAGVAPAVINHALRLLRQLERSTQEKN